VVRRFREDRGSAEKRKTGRRENDVKTVKHLDLVGWFWEARQEVVGNRALECSVVG
jgi:hypothetical protein